MPPPIRCFSTNEDIGQYYLVLSAIRKHLKQNPPKDGEKNMMDYFNEFTLTSYPARMRITCFARFQDAHLITHDVLKNTKS